MRTTWVRGLIGSALVVSAVLGPLQAQGGVWPTEPERLAKDLASADVADRRAATKKLVTLPSSLAKSLVIQALGDPDNEVRITAAEAANVHRVPKAGDLVATWLNEPDSKIRLAACRVLQFSPSAKAMSSLGRVLGDANQEVREAAAIALGNSNNGDAVVALLGHLDDTVPAVRVEIVKSLYRLGDPRAVVPLLGKVQDSVSDVRRVVVRALGELGDPRSSTAVVLALRDSQTEVKIEALTALGKIRDTSTVLSIAPLLDPQTPPAVRRAALAALGQIGGDRALSTLTTELENDDPTSNTTPAKDALVGMGDAAIAGLTAVLQSPTSQRSAALAAEALGALKAKPAREALVQALRKGSVPATSGLKALAELRDPEALPVVLELLGDPSPTVRTEARAAANVLLDPKKPDGRAVDPILSALNSPSATNVEKAALATLLGKTGSPRAATGLSPLLTSSVPAIKMAALDGLSALGSTGGQDDALLAALKDDSAALRAKAAVALASSASEATCDKLLTMITSTDEQDRGALTEALGGALSRVQSAAIITKAVQAAKDADMPMRDAIIEGVGRSRSEAARQSLTEWATSREIADRRKVAEALASQPELRQLAWKLTQDYDAGVRANAVWALGSIGTKDDFDDLAKLAADPNTTVAANATAALSRIAVRTESKEQANTHLCNLLSDGRSYVRAAAITGLTNTGTRCGDGENERTMLTQDDSSIVRSATADLLQRVTSAQTAKDQRALSRCRIEDPFGQVATRCMRPRTAITERDMVTVLVVPEGQNSPKSDAAYALTFADGIVRHGVSDRRGAIFELSAPRGQVVLSVPAAFTK